MFTGLVESTGIVSALKTEDDGTTMVIGEAEDILLDARLGDSISINGTCLTVTSFTTSTFTIGVAPETLRRTNLGSLKASSRVNLERAVSAMTRMGGHFVQGHVDTTATIVSVVPDGEALRFRLRPRDAKVLRYIVEKGYVALDGASLTVTRVDDKEGWFEVMLIAYTQEKVVTAAKKEGEDVNLEVDMMGKYVEKSVSGYLDDQGVGQMGTLEKMIERIVERKISALDAGAVADPGRAKVESTKQS